MERVGAKVYNCYYDDEDALLATLIKCYGENVHSYMLPNDREEFVELFPALAAEITYEILEDRLSRIPAGNSDPFINYVFQKINYLRNENPYNRSSIPWLSDKKLLELYQLKKDELDKRRLIEDTYILGPEQAGKLFDEDVARLRGKDSFEWILGRLKDLGFNQKETEEGTIKKKKNNGKYPIGSFKMQDSWKNDLKTKLINRIEEVLRRN